MIGLSSLNSIAVIERDINDEILLTWSYPTVDEKLEPVITNRTLLDNLDNVSSFTFSKFENNWIYIYTQDIRPLKKDKKKKSLLNNNNNNNNDDVEDDQIEEIKDEEADSSPKLYSDRLDDVTGYSLVMIAKTYNPELFGNLTKILSKSYLVEADPLKLLSSFLSVFSSSRCKLTIPNLNEDEEDYQIIFDAEDHNSRQALLATEIKDIVRMFGAEIVLLWTALLMKKRVAVFCDRLPILLKVIRSFPLFVWHRQDWEQLRPFVTINDVEIDELKRTGVYCAGFIDPKIKLKSDLFDLLIDINERTFTVAEHAKSDFRMGSIHKEIANLLLESSEDPEETSLSMIKDLSESTKSFLNNMMKLSVEDEDGNRYITLDSLQERNLPTNMETFIYNVASAEGLTQH